jgi:hypothetical protein
MTLLLGYRRALDTDPIIPTLKHQPSLRTTLPRLLHRVKVNPGIYPVQEIILVRIRRRPWPIFDLATRRRGYWVDSRFCRSQVVSK